MKDLEKFIKRLGRPRKLDHDKIKEEYLELKAMNPGHPKSVYIRSLMIDWNCSYDSVAKILSSLE